MSRPSDAGSTDVVQRVLCVDLDGTLIRTDLFAESLLLLLKRHALYSLMLPLWWLRGRAFLKQAIAQRVSVNYAQLPYRTDVLAFLKQERERGVPIILATACDRRLALGVADHLSLFAEIHASDGHTNLKGRRKADLLAERFGSAGFIYLGDSPADLPVWRRAAAAVVVGASSSLKDRVAREVPIERVFDEDKGSHFFALVRAMRPHQWLKNLLLFVPLVAAHKIADIHAWSEAAQGFAVMCLVTASIYMANDLLDLEADRLHRSKRQRPFAGGQVSVWAGITAVPLLLMAGLLLALPLRSGFVAWVCAYAVAALAYSLRLKHVAIVDVLTLAALYAVRLLAGAAAIAVPMSEWLLAFSLFFFLSLALLKRVEELVANRDKASTAPVRGYRHSDLQFVAILGIASGLVAVLVMALYINSREVTVLYSHPEWLWGFCPSLLYWISRVWLLAWRGEMHEDPILFAATDGSSYMVLTVLGVCMFLAS